MNGEKDKVEGLEIQVNEDIEAADVPSTSLSTPLSGVSVAARGKGDIDHEFYYPENVASKAIALSTTADLGCNCSPKKRNNSLKVSILQKLMSVRLKLV